MAPYKKKKKKKKKQLTNSGRWGLGPEKINHHLFFNQKASLF
jgi:hypothetical protein